MRDQHQTTENETPLQGWKEIAAYLERDQRTARRWEAEERLPVRRYRSDRRSSVYAYPSEIETWRTNRPVSRESAAETGAPEEPQAAHTHTWVWSAVAAVLLLAGFFYILRSPELNPFVEAQSGIVTTEIYGNFVVGKISPDGRYLSDTDYDTSGDIAIRDLETGEFRRVGDKASWDDGEGESDASIFSFDGQQIAYNWLVVESGDWHYELRTVDALAENPQPRVVFSDPDVDWIEPEAWTRDGRILVWVSSRIEAMRLAFLSLESGELQTIRTFDGELIPYQDGSLSAALSPDEAWVAYDAVSSMSPSGITPQPDIYLISLEDNSERQITTRSAADRVAGFAPDNRTLLFFSDRAGSGGLWSVSISGGEDPELLLRDLGDVAPLGILEDGSVVYSRSVGSRDLVSAEVDVETGRLLRPARLLETQQLGSNEGPWFSPDESQFAYLTRSKISGVHLFVHDVSSGAERELPTGGMIPRVYVYWSPSGDRLLMLGRKDNLMGTFEIDVNTGEVRKLYPAGPRPMGWLADGASILFRDPGKMSLLRPGDTDPQRIYQVEEGLVQSHALSPGRERIAWREVLTGELPGQRLKVMPVKGGEVRTVGQGAVDSGLGIALNWTPDGNALFVSHNGTQEAELWIHPVDGGEPVKLDLTDFRVRNVAMLRDGRTIVYQRGDADRRIFRTQNFLPAAADAE